MKRKIEVLNPVLKNKEHYLTSDYKTRNKSRPNHLGMDLVGKNGLDEIIAIEDGVVASTGYGASAGNYIRIKTNGIEQCYFHLKANSIKVKKGDVVKKGQIIASMGKSGDATGNHLHLAIQKRGVYLDPLPYLENVNPFNLEKEDELTNFIRRVQEILNVKVTGIANFETLAKTITISKTENWNHPLVKVIQTYLAFLGYDLGKYGIDGKFGAEMQKVVKQYQKDVVLLKDNLIDGVITAKRDTWKKLLNLK